MPKTILVFGSNEAGIHGAGAALTAYKQHGARYGKCYGHHGDSFAIPTKNIDVQEMPITRIAQYVQGFLAFAAGHPKMKFRVTRIGCGLAGYTDQAMADLFMGAPANCQFDEAWQPYLGDTYTYWGTF